MEPFTLAATGHSLQRTFNSIIYFAIAQIESARYHFSRIGYWGIFQDGNTDRVAGDTG